MRFRCSSLVLLGALAIIPRAACPQNAPVLFYSDLDSGASSGGEGSGGVYVTIYGNNLGASQGSSLVKIGATPATTYKLWSNSRVAFQIPAGTPAGAQNLSITVNGITSNTLPFTVRTTGNIYCVSTSGNDLNPGTFPGGCWQTVQHAVDTMAAGDTTYLRQGVVAASTDYEGSVQIGLNSSNNGSPGNPIALGGYPGEIATIGSSGSGICSQSTSNCSQGLHAVGGINLSYTYWTIFNLRLRGQQYGLVVDGQSRPAAPSSNWRIIGNDISCPYMNGASGPYCATVSQTNYVWFYGNVVHDIQTYPYAQAPGPEWNGGVYFTTDTNHVWCAWNQVYNVQGARGIQVHSSPVNGGGPGDPTGSNQYDLHIHDNVVHDIAMDGILFATVDPSKGPVEAYNNVVYNAGKGPQPGGSGYYSGIYVMGLTNTGAAGSGIVEVYNNTLYNNGGETITLGPGWGAALATSAPQNGSPNLRVRVRNNLVHQPGSGEYFWAINDASGDSSATSSAIYGSNNLFYGNAAPAGNPNITNSVYADPQFANLAAYDFHLSAASAAADAGTAVPLSADLDGVPAPQGAGYPIGAYEYGSGASPAPVVSVSLSPAAATLAGGQTQQFTATVTNASNTSVTWSLSPAIGAVSSTGLYSAPATVSAQQVVSVIATSVADPSRSAAATVTLKPLSITVTPAAVTLKAGQTQQFTAAAAGGLNSAVTWSLNPAVGQISTAGLYTAPASITTQQIISVIATSVADPSKSGSASVTLVRLPQISGVGATTIDSSTATIVWTTNTAATSQVDYGATAAYGWSSALNSQMVLSHSVVLAGLLPSTLYHFRVRSSDANGQTAVSGDYTFTTLPVPTPGSGGFSWTITKGPDGSPSQLNLSWTAPAKRTPYDYIILTSVDAPDWWGVWQLDTGGAGSGTAVLAYPSGPGSYEFRYIYDNGTGATVARSATLQVGAAGFAVVVSPASPAAGGLLSISWTAGTGPSSNDIVGLFRTGARNDRPIWYVYTDGAVSGSFTHKAPATSGQYQLRYLTAPDDLMEVVKSAPIIVQ